MSKIVELAQVIDSEINDLQHRVDYLQSELAKEKERRKKYLGLIREVIEQYQYEGENDYV